MKGKTGFVLMIGLCLTLFAGCSTRRNTAAVRAYHELTTRYNVYFNAEEAYNDALKGIDESYKDNWHELLPMYPNSSILGDTATKQQGGAFDRTIEKTTKAIEEHSITAKPRRDRSQSNMQEYRDWLRQNEFNPFIDRAWLLMGKAHVQNRDYTDAVSVLSQTAQLFDYDIDVVSEAQIWMMRAYTEMGWFADAESHASTLQARKLPKNLYDEFIGFYAFLLLRQENWRDAAPFLAQTIDNERNRHQKRRLQFLLGQLYTNLGERENAYQAFEKVKSIDTPYDVSFNALMAQSQVSGGATIIGELQKMTRSKKNNEYLDQIYAAIGNIYLSQNNVDKAIENYLLAEKKSVRNDIDKALAQVKLGDIYFDRKEFVKAEPRYSAALGVLPKHNANYSRVEFRSAALKELVPHLTNIAEQDSLQHLAQLPHQEQLKIINVHIGELKKKARAEERDALFTEQQSRVPQPDNQQSSAAESAVALLNRSTDTEFYFYNPLLVAQGKTEFHRRWGNRSLQDNWRLRNSVTSPQDTLSPLSPNSIIAELPDHSADPYTPEYYLQQLPTTPETQATSDKIIESGLFEGGKLAKDRLEDFDFATQLFERYLRDFPESDNRKDVYYQLYLMNLRSGNNVLARSYKSKIVSEFPESEYAEFLSDPNYEHVMLNFVQAQDSLYQQTYQAYQNGQSEIVDTNYEQAKKLFANGYLMPKFGLLHALSFAQTGDAEKLKSALGELIEKYPDSEETKLGQSILDGLSEGRTLVANASAVSGISWQSREQEIVNDTVQFSLDKNVAHSFLLLFSANAATRNRLLFAVSDFNFSHFKIRMFNTAYMSVSSFEALRIKAFRSFDEAVQYAQMIEADSVFRQNVPQGIVPLVISDENLELLGSRKSLAEYMAFINDSVQVIVPIKEPEIVPEPEKVVPLEHEKPNIPIVVSPQQARHETMEQRQTELERKAEEALKQTNNALSKRDREKMLKDREKTRKKLIKQRERELKQREKARKEELKQRERERRQKLKEQEQLRREKQKERERILRERNR